MLIFCLVFSLMKIWFHVNWYSLAQPSSPSTTSPFITSSCSYCTNNRLGYDLPYLVSLDMACKAIWQIWFNVKLALYPICVATCLRASFYKFLSKIILSHRNLSPCFIAFLELIVIMLALYLTSSYSSIFVLEVKYLFVYLY